MIDVVRRRSGSALVTARLAFLVARCLGASAFRIILLKVLCWTCISYILFSANGLDDRMALATVILGCVQDEGTNFRSYEKRPG